MSNEEREKRIAELKKELFILEHTKNCKQCGKEFMRNGKSIYCSAQCRRQHYFDNMTDEQKEKYEKYEKYINNQKAKRKFIDYSLQTIPDICYSTEKIYGNDFYGNSYDKYY